MVSVDPCRLLVLLAASGLGLLAACSAPPAATPTSTLLPAVPAVASPAASPSPSPLARSPSPVAATPTPSPLVVYGTAGDGLSLRSEPQAGAERIKVLPEGTLVTPLGEERQNEGRTWRRVREPDGAEGWVAADFLTDPATATAVPAPTATTAAAPTTAPAPTTAAAPTAAGPTRPVPELRPTFTTVPKPSGPTPTTAPAAPTTAPAGPTAASTAPAKPTVGVPAAPTATQVRR